MSPQNIPLWHIDYFEFKALKRHQVKGHSDTFSSKKFLSKYYLLAHNWKHTGEKHLECPKYGKCHLHKKNLLELGAWIGKLGMAGSRWSHASTASRSFAGGWSCRCSWWLTLGDGLWVFFLLLAVHEEKGLAQAQNQAALKAVRGPSTVSSVSALLEVLLLRYLASCHQEGQPHSVRSVGRPSQWRYSLMFTSDTTRGEEVLVHRGQLRVHPAGLLAETHGDSSLGRELQPPKDRLWNLVPGEQNTVMAVVPGSAKVIVKSLPRNCVCRRASQAPGCNANYHPWGLFT